MSKDGRRNYRWKEEEKWSLNWKRKKRGLEDEIRGTVPAGTKRCFNVHLTFITSV